jgi:nucleotide-binding universal stress UspA family protein
MATMPIVAGVDGSEESLRAVEWAALEARRHRASLRIVSAPGSRSVIGGIQHALLSHARGPVVIVPDGC